MVMVECLSCNYWNAPSEVNIPLMNKFILILLVLFCGACATPQHTIPAKTPETFSNEEMNELAMYAMSLAETPYRYGGNSPETGFDCSGFVHHVFKKSLGFDLPRTSQEISRMGEPLKEDQLNPGDLVFFNTQQQPFSHVGIYVGESRFVHAPKKGKAISIVSMRDNYWRSRYEGARRIASSQR